MSGIPTASGVTSAREQAHALAVALDDQAVAVVLDFVDPPGWSGTVAALVGMQGSKGDLSMAG